MHGRPHLPLDVVSIEATWGVGPTRCMTAWSVFAPGSTNATVPQLETLLSQFFLFPFANLFSVLPNDTTCRALRLTTGGNVTQRIDSTPPSVFGGGGSSDPVGLCAVLTWRAFSTPRIRPGHTHLPLLADNVGPDRRMLTDVAVAQYQTVAELFRTQTNALVSPDGGLCVLALPHYSSAGLPLGAATWTPVDLGGSSSVVGVLKRRRQLSGQ